MNYILTLIATAFLLISCNQTTSSSGSGGGQPHFYIPNDPDFMFDERFMNLPTGEFYMDGQLTLTSDNPSEDVRHARFTTELELNVNMEQMHVSAPELRSIIVRTTGFDQWLEITLNDGTPAFISPHRAGIYSFLDFNINTGEVTGLFITEGDSRRYGIFENNYTYLLGITEPDGDREHRFTGNFTHGGARLNGTTTEDRWYGTLNAQERIVN